MGILSPRFRTSLDIAEVLTFSVVCSSPWTILPIRTSHPSDFESAEASKANSNLSSLLSLLVKTKRMNCVGLIRPSAGTRSNA